MKMFSIIRRLFARQPAPRAMSAAELEEKLSELADRLADIAATKCAAAVAVEREQLEQEREQVARERETLRILLNHNLFKVKSGVSLWLARN